MHVCSVIHTFTLWVVWTESQQKITITGSLHGKTCGLHGNAPHHSFVTEIANKYVLKQVDTRVISHSSY